LLVIVSIALMILASKWMVSGAVSIAARAGMSEFVVGLTIVAVGTSLPEIATTVTAIRRDHHELAVGGIFGSCLFNIVGVPAVMAIVSATAMPVAVEAVSVDVPIMILAVVACLPLFLTGHRMSRSEGVLFLTYYTAYVVLLYIRGSASVALSDYQIELLVLALPILVVTGVIAFRHLRQRRLAINERGDS
jgi:cation:H+ antiporter